MDCGLLVVQAVDVRKEAVNWECRRPSLRVSCAGQCVPLFIYFFSSKYCFRNVAYIGCAQLQSSVHFQKVNTPGGQGSDTPGSPIPCLHPMTVPTSNTTDHFFLLLSGQEYLFSLRVRRLSSPPPSPKGPLWDDRPPIWVSRTTHLGKHTPQQPWAPVSGTLASGALE